MSDMNEDDMELNAGVDILAHASAAVCSLYDATCESKQSKQSRSRGTVYVHASPTKRTVKIACSHKVTSSDIK